MLREYQQSAVDAALAWFEYKATPAIVNMPTGSGKSHVIAALVKAFAELGKRVLVLAHRKELLEQTSTKIEVPHGIYGASLGEKDLEQLITVAQIQSIYRQELEPLDVIIVDECHMLPNSRDLGQYWSLINKHPQAFLVGLSATPYRMKGGVLDWGNEVYKIGYEPLLQAGYLSPLSNKLCGTPDLSKVEIRAGEYVENQLALVMEDPALIDAACRAIIAYSDNRHSCLIFCVSIAHANLITHTLNNSGIPAHLITGETNQGERENIIEQFKAEYGEVRYIVNVNVLTVGFDAPNVDMIVCLRPTKSKALWEQMMGRGVRKADGKKNCLLIDMAGNLDEHGPLGSPFREKAKGETKPNAKICPECEEFVKTGCRQCPDCGYEFPEPERPKVTHEYDANIEGRTIHSDIITYDVKWVKYKKHLSKKGNETLMVSYGCDHGRYGNVAEWVMKNKINSFYKERGNTLGPINEYSWDDLLWHAESLKQPIRITVDHKGDFPKVLRYEWATTEMKIEEYLEDDIPY